MKPYLTTDDAYSWASAARDEDENVCPSMECVMSKRECVMSKRFELFQCSLLAISLAAQVFFLAPLYIFITNHSEFSISTYQVSNLLIPTTVVIATLLSCVTFFLKRKNKVIILSILTAFAIYLYIQFYFFVWDYGILDGREILWSNKHFVLLVEIPTIFLLFALSVFFPKKFFSYGLIVLSFLFLGESAVTAAKYFQLKTTLRPAKTPTSGDPDIFDFFRADNSKRSLLLANYLSTEKNVIIILIDTLQSDIFEKIIDNDPSIRKKMEGFVFFRNSAGVFPYTTLTIPAILTGRKYKPNENIDGYAKRISEYRIDNILKSKGFSVSSIPLNSRVDYLSSNSQRSYEIATIFDIVIFRHVPHFLKPVVFNNYKFLLRPIFLSKVPTLNPEIDLAVFESLLAKSFVGGDEGHFKFLHFWGMHPPAMLDKNCRVCESSHKRAAVEGQAYCMVKQVVRYLERLKKIGVYDKSLIFLIADTGSKYPIQRQIEVLAESEIPEFVFSSAHPVIAVKDFGLRGEFRFSDAAVSLIDVAKTSLTSLNLDPIGMEGFDLFSIKEKQERVRSFFYYKGANEARLKAIPQMQEFIIKGFIRDRSSWETGRMYVSSEIGEQIMSFVDFGEQESAKFQDLGWSVEAKGYHVSWTIAERASLIGQLPQKESVKMVARLRNPHPDQKVEARLNGRSVATWEIDKPCGFRQYVAQMELTDEDRKATSRVEFIIEKSGVLSDKDARELGILVDWVKFE